MSAAEITVQVPSTATPDEMLDAWAAEARRFYLTVLRTGVPISRACDIPGRDELCRLIKSVSDHRDYLLYISASEADAQNFGDSPTVRASTGRYQKLRSVPVGSPPGQDHAAAQLAPQH